MDSINIIDLDYSLEEPNINSLFKTYDYTIYMYIGIAILVIIIGIFIFKFYQNKKNTGMNNNNNGMNNNNNGMNNNNNGMNNNNNENIDYTEGFREMDHSREF
jgi:hypothetical protein